SGVPHFHLSRSEAVGAARSAFSRMCVPRSVKRCAVATRNADPVAFNLQTNPRLRPPDCYRGGRCASGAPPDPMGSVRIVDDAALMALFRSIAEGDASRTSQLLATTPELATSSLRAGATRANPSDGFLTSIGHYVYRGDTALHVAAAAY